MRGWIVAALLSIAAPAAAQPPEPLHVGIAVAAEHAELTYRFTNPSSFDPGPLVPHFFEQRYALDNLWLAIDARCGAGGIRWTTSGGVALPRRLRRPPRFAAAGALTSARRATVSIGFIVR